jgi:hypothetical protein
MLCSFTVNKDRIGGDFVALQHKPRAARPKSSGQRLRAPRLDGDVVESAPGETAPQGE